MEVGASSRVTITPTTADFTRPVPKTPPEAVKTELPGQKSVQQAGVAQQASVSESKSDAKSSIPVTDPVERNLSIDLETQKVVFRAVDGRTGEVIVQFPDPRYLKAYLDQKHASETEPAGDVLARSA